jgi:hypothetical protein
MRTVTASAIRWARALSHRLPTPPRRSGCRGRSGKAAPGVSTSARATSYARILAGFASPIVARLRCRRWRDRALSVGAVGVAARTVAGLIAVSGPARRSGGGTQAPASSAPGLKLTAAQRAICQLSLAATESRGPADVTLL